MDKKEIAKQPIEGMVFTKDEKGHNIVKVPAGTLITQEDMAAITPYLMENPEIEFTSDVNKL
jgi:hypothetical protein